jgi:hypothetical protein
MSFIKQKINHVCDELAGGEKLLSRKTSMSTWLARLPLDPRFAGSNPAEDDGF